MTSNLVELTNFSEPTDGRSQHDDAAEAYIPLSFARGQLAAARRKDGTTDAAAGVVCRRGGDWRGEVIGRSGFATMVEPKMDSI